MNNIHNLLIVAYFDNMGNQSEPNKATILTTNSGLQEKLNKLNRLAQEDEIEEFINNFVPLDLSPDDLDYYKYVGISKWLCFLRDCSRLVSDHNQMWGC